MIRISEQAKQAIIKKVLSNNGQTMAEIAHANNVGHSTLSKWVRCFKSEGTSAVHKKVVSVASEATLAERFKHVQETFGKEDGMVGAYCRRHGLYPHQLAQWEADFMTKTPDQKQAQSTAELKGLRAENKTLKSIIARKDKVLAETVALLVLKKKAAQIWGESEDD